MNVRINTGAVGLRDGGASTLSRDQVPDVVPELVVFQLPERAEERGVEADDGADLRQAIHDRRTDLETHRLRPVAENALRLPSSREAGR